MITGVGIVIGVAYTLRAMQKAFFGDAVGTSSTSSHPEHEVGDAVERVPTISVPERLGAMLLIGVSLLVGLYPRLLLDVIVPSFNSPLFDWLKKGGAQ